MVAGMPHGSVGSEENMQVSQSLSVKTISAGGSASTSGLEIVEEPIQPESHAGCPH